MQRKDNTLFHRPLGSRVEVLDTKTGKCLTQDSFSGENFYPHFYDSFDGTSMDKILSRRSHDLALIEKYFRNQLNQSHHKPRVQNGVPDPSRRAAPPDLRRKVSNKKKKKKSSRRQNATSWAAEMLKRAAEEKKKAQEGVSS